MNNSASYNKNYKAFCNIWNEQYKSDEVLLKQVIMQDRECLLTHYVENERPEVWKKYLRLVAMK
jgi:hypothetical protein